MESYNYKINKKEVSRKKFLKSIMKNEKDRINMIKLLEKSYEQCIPNLQELWDVCTKKHNFAPQVCQVQLNIESQKCAEIKENISILKNKRLPKKL